MGIAEEENEVAPKSPSPCRFHQNGMVSTQHCKSPLVMRPKISEFKALHQSRAARKGVQDATLETHRHTSGNPPSPDRLESVGCFRILATPPPPPSSGSFSIRQAALRYLAPWVPEQTGVRSDFHSFLVLAKSSNLGDAHLDGLQGSLISPSHATETMPIEAMPSAFHEFSDESR